MVRFYSVSGHLPTKCPSCDADLHVVSLACSDCDTTVSGAYTLPVLSRLSDADQEFVLSFVRSSGSLKKMARRYRVSYPTVRNRLNDLIARVNEVDETELDDGNEQERFSHDSARDDARPLAV